MTVPPIGSHPDGSFESSRGKRPKIFGPDDWQLWEHNFRVAQSETEKQDYLISLLSQLAEQIYWLRRG